ncbi:MAG: hypothetical protein HC929_10695 [Leptolyngbyaceae cyanobacterium SM2_5_2]|nr:hypothetical protein [Leptolyngbyaceae cyanobacterium SM2_5_2]
MGLTGLGVELQTLCREPLQGLTHLWLKIYQGLGFAAKPPSRASTQRRGGASRPLSVVEAVLWVGGGVIARAALNLLLAAFPSL